MRLLYEPSEFDFHPATYEVSETGSVNFYLTDKLQTQDPLHSHFRRAIMSSFVNSYSKLDIINFCLNAVMLN